MHRRRDSNFLTAVIFDDEPSAFVIAHSLIISLYSSRDTHLKRTQPERISHRLRLSKKALMTDSNRRFSRVKVKNRQEKQRNSLAPHFRAVSGSD